MKTVRPIVSVMPKRKKKKTRNGVDTGRNAASVNGNTEIAAASVRVGIAIVIVTDAAVVTIVVTVHLVGATPARRVAAAAVVVVGDARKGKVAIKSREGILEW